MQSNIICREYIARMAVKVIRTDCFNVPLINQGDEILDICLDILDADHKASSLLCNLKKRRRKKTTHNLTTWKSLAQDVVVANNMMDFREEGKKD